MVPVTIIRYGHGQFVWQLPVPTSSPAAQQSCASLPKTPPQEAEKQCLHFLTIDLCCSPVVNEVLVGGKVLPYSWRHFAANGAFPAPSFQLGGVGVAIVVEGWPLHTLHLQLPHLGRGGGEKRRR